MLKDNELNPFNISTRSYHCHSPLLELLISYVKHCFQFFSFALNHFSLKAHLVMPMNMIRYFFILGFFLCYEIKFLLNKLKTNAKKKHQNVIIFVIFSINSFQLFYDNNLTLTITNSNDFNEIDQYKNITKFINISEGIYTIPSGAFSGWPLVISVNFGNSISYIGGSAFSSCSHLETIIFGGNVTYISGSAFSFCSSIKNITIPNSATLIGGYAFSFCSNLMILTLGSGITEIGDSAFSNCNSLECIYYYGDTEPNIGENAFCNVTAIVITYPTYIESNFGKLKVIKSYAEGNCKPIPTLSFSASDIYSQSNTFSLSNIYSQSNTFSLSNTYSQSNTFSLSNTYSQSNTFSRSNTYSQSNTFTESFQSDFTLSFSYTLTYTLTIEYSFTYYETQTRSLSLSLFNSTFSYIETEFLYYDYTVIMYSTHYNYYSNFITMFRTNILLTDGLTTNALIGIVCGSIALVLIIVGIVIFLIKSNNNKRKSTSTLQFKDSTTSSLNQKEDVNTLVEDIVKEDEDNWL